ncbi:hypothetical protein [uncultured Gammaproteobacteria bacterium]|nr:hypothetical protein [uncultured Gammaproteobacteria bacterium]CAC9977135.1 hypothetical protein [uncultured Gammaproteobacteria bacterium]
MVFSFFSGSLKKLENIVFNRFCALFDALIKSLDCVACSHTLSSTAIFCTQEKKGRC